jgi:hypothetical protein
VRFVVGVVGGVLDVGCGLLEIVVEENERGGVIARGCLPVILERVDSQAGSNCSIKSVLLV